MPLSPSLAPSAPPPVGRCDPRLDDSQADDWIQLPAATRQSLGVGLAALSALISTFALLIMKHSADVEKGLPLRPSCKHPWRKRWWIGFIMNTGSELGISTFALMFVPMTVIAPVNGSAVIFSALVARLGWVSDRIYRITQVREYLSYLEWLALFAVVGTPGVAHRCHRHCPLRGPSPENTLPLPEVQEQFSGAPFLALAIPAGVYVVLCVAILVPRSPLKRWRPAPNSLRLSLLTAAGAGVAGAFSMTFGKVTWLALGVLVASAPTQLWLLNWALGSGKASFTVPLYTVMIISTNIVLGGLLFDEFACLSRAYLFVCAFVMVVVGVCLLSPASGGKQPGNSVTLFVSIAGASTAHASVDIFRPREVRRSRRNERLSMSTNPLSSQNRAHTAFGSRRNALEQIIAQRQPSPAGSPTPTSCSSPVAPQLCPGSHGSVRAEELPAPVPVVDGVQLDGHHLGTEGEDGSPPAAPPPRYR
ncbi:hypothetical protein EMIHUDRAFT_468441 [Emiliania huxleyi CCMP1516]|uniref:EamA domain-containing protein n=2 Tax=Emiliania huxleyi TaxID=2903 RepID=A0A0D3K398_EMIH1|nr:hypothetical protein EMIHUDRAFT_468441 [Emiliania huxleyi CCMP1516]EOD30233.1 hypothetical protein EMIHUDRAFT_468441 [Emiliania huxleyi CCMP1516]|eukprot:XP_005782662.1 hypothetical protein EMIHUDRAFT_468441 [Emiliania huxleyi CCMP1516]